MRKIYILLLFSMFLSISLVSAFDWNDGHLLSYNTMDTSNGTNGTFNNVSLEYDRILVGVNVTSVPGIIHNAFKFGKGTGGAGNYSAWNTTFNANTTWTINQWENITSLSGGNDYSIFLTDSLGGGSDKISLFYDSSGNPKLELRNINGNIQTVTGNQTITANTFHMTTFRFNNGIAQLFINGSIVASLTMPNQTDYTATYVHNPRFNLIDSMVLDEIGIWNNVLTPTNITELYNGGSGLPFAGSNPLSITSLSPNSPVQMYQSSNPIVFGANVSGTLVVPVNVSLIINGTVNQTNTSGFRGIYNFSTNLPIGVYNWSILAYDNNTVISQSSPRFITISNIIENNQTYNTTTSEIISNDFSINVTLDSGVTSSSAILVYNNTNYTSTKTTDGLNTIFTTSVVAPSVNSNTNIPFYWIISITDPSGTSAYTSATINQTVLNIAIDDCSTYTNLIINFTNYDQDTRVQLKSPVNNNTFNIDVLIGDSTLNNYIRISNNKSNVDYSAICAQNPIAGSFRMDLVMQSSSTGHVSQYYNIQNYTLTANTSNQSIQLNDLATTSSQEFLITIRDENYNPLTGAVVEINRQYVNLGGTLIAEIPITDTLGTSIGHFVTNEVLYNINVKRNGLLLATFNNIRVYCNPSTSDCVLNLNIPSSSINPSDYKIKDGVYYLASYNVSTQIYSLNFISSDSNARLVTLSANVTNPYQNISICSQSITATSGTLTCVISSAYQNSSAIVTATVNGDVLFTDNLIVSYSKSGILTNARYLVAGFIFLPLMVLLAGSSGGLAVLFYLLGLLASIGFYLVDTQSYIGPGSFFVWFAVAGIIVIWKISKGGTQNG